MAKKSPYPTNKTPSSDTPEERYLDLWEENVRLIAANGTAPKSQNPND